MPEQIYLLIYLLWVVICLLAYGLIFHSRRPHSLSNITADKNEENNKCQCLVAPISWGTHLKRLLAECGKITCDNFDLAYDIIDDPGPQQSGDMPRKLLYLMSIHPNDHRIECSLQRKKIHITIHSGTT